MRNAGNYYDAVSIAAAAISADATAKLKTLFETKHLYQRVKLDTTGIVEKSGGQVIPAHVDNYKEAMHKKLHQEGFDLLDREPTALEVDNGKLTLGIGNVELFCPKCDGRKVFSPYVWLELVPEVTLANLTASKPKPNKSSQLFAFVYHCGVCHSPIGFLIHRDDNNILTIAGRSPMESLETPAYIPKKERSFYVDAIIAMNAGKHLAALFYLRTFIEQFARRITGKQSERATGEDIMNAYVQTLPVAHREQMPSLGEWYSKLSEALHAARPDDVLFKAAREEIEKHFDIRRVFKIPEER